jgi:hypothetical protein
VLLLALVLLLLLGPVPSRSARSVTIGTGSGWIRVLIVTAC